MYRAIGGAKSVLSYLPYLKLVKPPLNRSSGISVVVRSCNEEWIEHSLKSLKNFADELIVIDASTDGTPAKVERIAKEEGLKLKLIRLNTPLNSYMGDTETHVYHSNLGLRYAGFRWVVVWDGDHIAYTSGPNNIQKLRDILMDLPTQRYFQIHVNIIDLHGDFFHTVKGGIHLRLESFTFTWSPSLKFYDAGRFERMNFPLYYKRTLLPNIHIVHLASVKKARNLLYRRFWTPWREMRDFLHFPTLQDYVKYRMKAEFGADSEEEGIKMAFRELATKLIKCDYLSKDCPDVLRDELKKPRYKILYKDGRIVGRNDLGVIL